MANTKDGSQLTGLILARRRRRRSPTDLLVKARQNDAAPVVFTDWLFDEPAPVGGAYTLTCQGGSYALTGASATLLRSKRIVANGGSYTLTGQNASLNRNRRLTASGGSYTQTGQSAIIYRNRRLTASGGSYALTGQSAILLRSKRIVATGGSYALTGQEATVLRSRRIEAGGGEYIVSGSTADITVAMPPEIVTDFMVLANGRKYDSSAMTRQFINAGSVRKFDTSEGRTFDSTGPRRTLDA